LVLTIAATARLLGVSELTVRRRIRAGTLPAVQIGGSWRIPGPSIHRIAELPEKCTIRQIAHSLDVSELTVRRWIKDGHLPATKSDRSWVVDRNDLSEILRLDAAI
jgi:excisionase family DNA binding protein